MAAGPHKGVERPWPRRLSLLGRTAGVLLVTVSLGSLAYAWFAAPVSHEGIIITNNGQHFGSVRWQEPMDLSFEVRNQTPHAVTLVTLTTTCGCTKPETSRFPFVLGPGDATDVQATFKPYNTQAGEELRALALIVESPGGVRTLHELHFRIQVRPDYRIEPAQRVIDFGEVGGDVPLTRKVRVVNDGIPGLRIDRIEPYPADGLDSAVHYHAAADISEITVTLDPSIVEENRRWTGRLRLHFDRPTGYDRPSLSVRAIRRASSVVADASSAPTTRPTPQTPKKEKAADAATD